MANINDIAKLAGVAKSTVSNVLTGKKYVSPQIKEKVLKICQEIDYQPNFYASTLSNKGQTNIIGLFLEQTDTSSYKKFYSSLIESILTTIAGQGKSLLIYSGLDSEDITSKLKSGASPIDGAIMLSPKINDIRIKEFSKSVIPCIVIGNPGNNMFNYVDTDNAGLTKFISQEMIKQGYTNICLINANEELIISQQRNDGFKKALKKHQGVIGKIYHSKESTVEDGYTYAREALESGATAFICCSGSVSKGVYKACEEKNIKIGEDVVIFSLGYSFSEQMEFNPTLSYAIQDYQQFGKIASNNLIRKIKGEENIENEMIQSDIHIHKSFKLSLKIR